MILDVMSGGGWISCLVREEGGEHLKNDSMNKGGGSGGGGEASMTTRIISLKYGGANPELIKTQGSQQEKTLHRDVRGI